MTSKLKEYFPMIQEREKVLERIQSNRYLRILFSRWETERQEEFLDFCTGMRGIKILYDSFFKEVLNPEYAPERLDSFLSALLKKKVRIVRILSNDGVRLADENSLLVTDIIVELEDGSLANVEVQKVGYAFVGERSACYSADMLLRQYKRVRSAQGADFSYRDVKTVYLIVIYENSPKEFKKLPTKYCHHGKQVFDTGLELDMLQEFILIPLDIFRENMENKSIETPLDAWLTFLTSDEPERIIELITSFPEFKPMYETIYRLCQNMERVMEMFSKELQIMDRNTVKYMIEEQAQEIEAQAQEIEAQTREIEAQTREIEAQTREIEEQAQEIETQAQEITAYKEAQMNAIENMLRRNMELEEISAILGCERSCVEAVKNDMQV